MKVILLFLVFMLRFSVGSHAQDINLQSIINECYTPQTKMNFGYDNLCYVATPEIGFLDTSVIETNTFKILYFNGTTSFKKRLKDKKKAAVVKFRLESVTPTQIIMRLSLSTIKLKNYTDKMKFYEFFDARIIALAYDEKSKKWEFKRLIKSFAHLSLN